MTAAYVPQAGHRITRPTWAQRNYVDVLVVDRGNVFGYDQDGYPRTYTDNVTDFVKVEKPRLLPEGWLAVDHRDDQVEAFDVFTVACDYWADSDIYRIWSDADGTPRIERVAA